MKRTAFAVLLAISAPALAQETAFILPDGSAWFFTEPPPKYVERPFDGYVEHSALEPQHLIETCTGLVGKHEPWGCATLTGRYCQVIYNADLPKDVQAAVIRHEEAHCKGWGAHHPVD